MITCKFKDGKSTSLRHCVTNVILIQDNSILLVKRSEKLSLEPGKWTVPGGFVDRDENVQEAATREVLEESGYSLKGLTLFRLNSRPDRPAEDRQNIDIVFIAQAQEKVGEPDWETSAVQWFGLDSLPPREEIAFDYYENIQLYLKWKKEHFPLPILT